MNTVSAYRDESAPAQPSRRVVDAPTRVFHWLLALCFVGAYATSEGERWRLVHITLGYSMIGLIAFRLIWFAIGPRPSRLSSWMARFRALGQVWSNACAGQIKWLPLQAGLNTLALVGVLLFTILAVASGYAVEQEWLGDTLEEVHEFAGNGMLAFVLGHIALVLGGWMLRSGTSWTSMFTGRVAGRGPDLVPRNRIWLGALMLAGVVGFWGYQWQNAPALGNDTEIGQHDSPGGLSVQAGRRPHHEDEDD